MKRFMFAIGLLATIAISESAAGYLVIRIVIEGGTASTTENKGPGGPGIGMGMSGIGGSSLGGPRPGGGGPPPGGPGPGGVGGPPKGGSAGGPPPGLGGSGIGGPPKGGSGGGPPPGIGGSGNAPPALGSPPSSGGTPGLGGTTTNFVNDPTRSIYVVVPYTNDIDKHYPFYKKPPTNSHNPTWQPAIKHPFGYANLMHDNSSIQVYLDLGPQSNKGLKTRYTELTSKHTKSVNAKDGQILLDLVTEALDYGYVAEAVKYSDELATGVADKKLSATPQVDRFLGAYAKIKDDLTRPSRSQSEGAAWRDRIGFAYSGVKDYLSPHYHMLYWEGMDSEMMRRVGQLEDNFKAFYLLNALRGVVLPVPERPQIVILARSTGDVRKLSASLDGSPLVSDAFYSPDHGVVVLSPERLDGVSQSFNRQIQDMFRQGVNRAQLLAGDGPKVDPKGQQKDSKLPEDVARMMTWVVAERYAEEEAEWSAVSREGTRQLLHAIGLMPQHVSLPLWLEEGSAGYYQRPKGPVFSKKDEKDYITVALTTGFGGPNYVRQKQFSEMVRLNQFAANSKDRTDAGQVLRNVVTDAYFAAALAGLDADDAKLPLPPTAKKSAAPAVSGIASSAAAVTEDPFLVKRRRAEFLTAKAQSTAWSLYYYLSKANPAGLDRYIAELGKMPRDLPLDENARLAAFATAFNLALDSKKKTGEQSTFENLGAAWFQYLSTVPPAGIDVALNDLATPSAPAGGLNGPSGPGLGGPGSPLGGPGSPPKPGGQ